MGVLSTNYSRGNQHAPCAHLPTPICIIVNIIYRIIFSLVHTIVIRHFPCPHLPTNVCEPTHLHVLLQPGRLLLLLLLLQADWKLSQLQAPRWRLLHELLPLSTLEEPLAVSFLLRLYSCYRTFVGFDSEKRDVPRRRHVNTNKRHQYAMEGARAWCSSLAEVLQSNNR